MNRQKNRIVVVDDDRELVQSITDILSGEGWDVTAAYTGKEAVELASRMKPDLMILDVMLSYETEGFDVSRRILETPQLKGLPILLLTGISKELSLSFELEPDRHWLPVEEVLVKPIDPETLISTIRSILAKTGK